MPNVVNGNQFQVVEDLLQRQDKALAELEELNNRVEQAILQVNAFREQHNLVPQEEAESETQFPSLPEQHQEQAA